MQKILLLLSLFLVCTTSLIQAQRSGADSPLKDKLWYGAGLSANYQASSISSTFTLGFAPMVGYKVNERLSFGPRFSYLVSFYKSRLFSNQPETAKPTDWSAGVFGRYRIAREFFAHVEYAFQNEAFITADASGLVINRETNNAFYIGGGYTSPISDLVGIEISLNYYVNQPINDFRNPLNYRFGINYRF